MLRLIFILRKIGLLTFVLIFGIALGSSSYWHTLSKTCVVRQGLLLLWEDIMRVKFGGLKQTELLASNWLQFRHLIALNITVFVVAHTVELLRTFAIVSKLVVYSLNFLQYEFCLVWRLFLWAKMTPFLQLRCVYSLKMFIQFT